MDLSPASDRLLLFVREPAPGRAKTRLVPALGPHGAAALYRRLAEHTARETAALARDGASVTVLVDPPAALPAVAEWLGHRFTYRPQAEGDLGARLAAAFAEAFGEGARRVVAIGSDCPGLDRHRLHEAFAKLLGHDAVLGPAVDGGYYLLGLSRPVVEVFRDIPWSTGQTLAATRARLSEAHATVALLGELRDVDTPEDLAAASAAHPWLDPLREAGGPHGRDEGVRRTPRRQR
ncbi:MAG: glycosyltransferase [Acidobacteria bacterium]|nr:MAG: glycosyltransferase [Acidobacteriota bacterium]